MISEIGHIGLIFTTCMMLMNSLSHYSCVYGGTTYQQLGNQRIYQFASLSIILSLAVLQFCFCSDDFGVKYIYENASLNLPIFFKLTALWSNHAGSWLLWITLTVLYGWYFAYQLNCHRIQSFSFAPLSVMIAWYGIYALYASNPFTRILPIAPGDGMDMNPLLQDLTFLIHPPCLYLGLCALSIPFTIACNLYYLPKYHVKLKSILHQWSLWAWGWLTIGICLGSFWAYRELGWGGWWFWDPVENAALMPWLICTGLLHITSQSEQKSSYLIIQLSILSFILTLVGTWITRSGLFVSVHSFATAADRNLILAAMITTASIPYILSLRQTTSQPNTQTMKISIKHWPWRTWQAQLMLATCFAVLIGTFYPLIFEILQGKKVVITNGYYATSVLPLALITISMMTAQIEINWTKSAVFIKSLLAIGCSAYLIYIFSFDSVVNQPSYITVCLIGGMIYGLLTHVESYFSLSNGDKAWKIYSHAIILCIALCMLINTHFAVEKLYSLEQGTTIKQGAMQLRLNRIETKKMSNYIAEEFNMHVQFKDQQITLNPEIRGFESRQMIKSKAGIQHFFLYDVYAVVAKAQNNAYIVRIWIKPLQSLFWLFGGLLGILAIHRSCQGKKYYLEESQ